jgi:hypothetical protein
VAIVEAIPKGGDGQATADWGWWTSWRISWWPLRCRPAHPIEQITAAVIQAVLGLNTLSVHDNFFMIGGDSLRGTPGDEPLECAV